jgi:succinate dehydrogenase / fumarate reductase flavoprotein subunit
MKHQERQISASVLVVGTGGSGQRAAIELAERGIDVLAVGKRPKLDAHTSLAAGGINAALAARATLEAALERRETRGCHNRSDYPALDPLFQVNLVWSGPGRLERESIPPIPHEIAALMREVSTAGKLVE